MKRNKVGHERREFPRFELPEGQLSAELGVGGSSSARTIVRDISLGGVKLDLPEGVLDQAAAGVCAVRFLDRDNHVVPATARGRIRRVDAHDGGHYVAVEFAEPLVSFGGGAPRSFGE